VEYARRYDVPVHVRSSFSRKQGTWVTDSAIPEAFLPARSAKAAETETESTMEQAIISGVAHDRSEAKVTIVGVPDVPGKAAEIFKTIAAQEIDIDMIVQTISTREPG
ncbi:aspartate kinase, partial [Burkholderia multivorans]